MNQYLKTLMKTLKVLPPITSDKNTKINNEFFNSSEKTKDSFNKPHRSQIKGKEPYIDTKNLENKYDDDSLYDKNSASTSESNNNNHKENSDNSIDKLASDLQSISVSNNDSDHSISDDIFLESNIKNTNLSSKRKLSVTEESNSKRRTNESSHSLNLIPLKHKLKNSNSSSNKKFKSSFNEPTKRPGSPITSDDNKKLKVTIDNVESSIKNIITDTPLTYKQAVTCKSKKILD